MFQWFNKEEEKEEEEENKEEMCRLAIVIVLRALLENKEGEKKAKRSEACCVHHRSRHHPSSLLCVFRFIMYACVTIVVWGVDRLYTHTHLHPRLWYGVEFLLGYSPRTRWLCFPAQTGGLPPFSQFLHKTDIIAVSPSTRLDKDTFPSLPSLPF